MSKRKGASLDEVVEAINGVSHEIENQTFGCKEGVDPSPAIAAVTQVLWKLVESADNHDARMGQLADVLYDINATLQTIALHLAPPPPSQAEAFGESAPKKKKQF